MGKRLTFLGIFGSLSFRETKRGNTVFISSDVFELIYFIISFSLKIILKNQNQLLMLTVDGKCICEDQARRVFNLEKTERPMNFHSAEPLHIDTSFIRTTL